jgi:hypothetical protein
MTLRILAASLGLALPLMAGCRSDETLNAPDLSNNNGMLQRYVSMGNSITAGFQSAGINDSTQLQSYAVIFAQQAHAPFFAPLLNKPGCPAPFVNNVTQARLGGASATDCALRETGRLPYVSNVAVPGALAGSILSNQVAANALTQFILGGRTQIAAMLQAQPTFVSLWIGNNDVLGSLTSLANPGNPALVTSEAAFEAAYTEVVDSLVKTGARAVLIGVADVSAIPYSTQGSVYWCLKTGACPGIPAAGFPPTFTVNNNCAPIATMIPGAKGDSTLVPWPVGVPRIAAAAQGASTSIDCSVDADVVLPAEFATLRDAVEGYNAFISSQASQHGWAYLDINPTLETIKLQDATQPAPGQLPRIATFPCLPGAPCGTGGALNQTSNVLFGTYFSLDGVHPSAAAHRAVADSLIRVVNTEYGTAIPFAGP